MEEIRNAIDEADTHRLNRAAHALKGSVANFGARSVFDTAFRLEMMGKDEELGEARETCEALENELNYLKKMLENFVVEMSHENSDSRR
jgi:HPt (histidine-containing phosphotransfer) domain-containing protein